MKDNSCRWKEQWDRFEHDGKDIKGKLQTHFLKYILPPYTLNDLVDKDVVDCGCGSGGLLKFLAPIAKSISGIDIVLSNNAKKNAGKFKNIRLIEGDLLKVKLENKFDIVIADGVLHHTINPSRGFYNIKNLLKQDGILFIMVYSEEGNFINKNLINPISKNIFQKFSSDTIHKLSKVFTLFLICLEKTIYRLKCKKIFYYQYITGYFRNSSFKMKVMDIYDQINAPMTHYISGDTVRRWFNDNDFYDISIIHQKGVTWVASGKRR